MRSRPSDAAARAPCSTRPPSHTAAAMMCSTSAITASWWFASSPEWPCVPIGTSAATARIATKKRRRPRRAPRRSSTVSAAPAIVVMSQVRPTSVSTRIAAELRAELGAGADRGVERVDEREEPGGGGRDGEDRRRDGCRVQRAGRTRARPPCSVNSAVTSTPTMPAAERLTNSFAVGSPQRTNGPGIADRERRGAAAVGERPRHAPRARPRRGSRARRPAARGGSPFKPKRGARARSPRTCRRGMPRARHPPP